LCEAVPRDCEYVKCITVKRSEMNEDKYIEDKDAKFSEPTAAD
jgi:hypothetical protein